MDNLNKYPTPTDSLSTIDGYFRGEKLLEVEVLERIGTRMLKDGEALWPNTPLLLPGVRTGVTPAMFDELAGKVKLLNVPDEQSGLTGGVVSPEEISRRGTVQVAPPPTNLGFVQPPQMLDVPSMSQVEEAAQVIADKQDLTKQPDSNVPSLEEVQANASGQVETNSAPVATDSVTPAQSPKTASTPQQVKAEGPQTNKEANATRDVKSEEQKEEATAPKVKEGEKKTK